MSLILFNHLLHAVLTGIVLACSTTAKTSNQLLAWNFVYEFVGIVSLNLHAQGVANKHLSDCVRLSERYRTRDISRAASRHWRWLAGHCQSHRRHHGQSASLSFFFPQAQWWESLLGSYHCLIREYNHGSPCLYCRCYDNVRRPARFVVAVWTQRPFINLTIVVGRTPSENWSVIFTGFPMWSRGTELDIHFLTSDYNWESPSINLFKLVHHGKVKVTLPFFDPIWIFRTLCTWKDPSHEIRRQFSGVPKTLVFPSTIAPPKVFVILSYVNLWY